MANAERKNTICPTGATSPSWRTRADITANSKAEMSLKTIPRASDMGPLIAAPAGSVPHAIRPCTAPALCRLAFPARDGRNRGGSRRRGKGAQRIEQRSPERRRRADVHIARRRAGTGLYGPRACARHIIQRQEILYVVQTGSHGGAGGCAARRHGRL